MLLNPSDFRRCFRQWVDELGLPLNHEIIAIDGKTARGSRCKAKDKLAIHTVTAWACEHKIVLGQLKVDDKSNEITAIPLLLDTLLIEGSVISIDAMGCQKNIAEKIIEKRLTMSSD